MADKRLQVILDMAGNLIPNIKSAVGIVTNLESAAKSAGTAVDNIDGKVNVDTSAAENNLKTVEKTAENASKTQTLKIDANTSAAESSLNMIEDDIQGIKDAAVAAGAAIALIGTAGGIEEQSKSIGRVKASVRGWNDELETSVNKIYQISGADWDTVTEATVLVKNQQGLLGGELEHTANQAIKFTSIFGEALPQTIQANSNIVQQFGIDSSTAFDILTRTMQTTGNKGEDLIDTFAEYPQDFKRLGFSAQDMGNMITSALSKGARNSDVFADAVREFGIRMLTSADDAKKAYTALGATTEQQKRWTAGLKEGGPAAKQATTEIVQALMSIQDPMKRQEAGVALFGSKWEDVGPLIGEAMLDGTNYLDDFKGAADQAGKDSSTSFIGNLEKGLRGISPIFGGAIDTIQQFGSEIAMTMAIAGSNIAAAKMTSTTATNAETAATNAGILSQIRARIASTASILTTYSSAAARDVAVGAAMAHAGAIEVNTAAENQGILARIRGTASTVASTVATSARTAATVAASAAQWALNAAMSANPIAIVIIAIVALVGVLIWLWTTNEGFRNALIGAWNAISGAVMPILQAIWNGLTWLWTTLTGLGAAAQQGGANFLNAIVTFFSQLPGRLWTLLLVVLVRIEIWRLQLINYARAAGIGFINNVILFISSLPGRVWAWLWSTILKIAAWATQIREKARQAGQNVVNGVISTITSLPGKVSNTLWNVVNTVTNFGGQAYDAAVKMAGNIWDGFKAGLGIHSPSYLEKAMDQIIDKAHEMPVEMKTVASRLGGIDWQSGSPQIDMPNTPTATSSASAMDAQNLTNSVATANTQYGLLKTTSDLTWSSMVTTAKSGFDSMKNNMKSTLDGIVSSNKVGYSTIQTTTQSTLNSLKSQTDTSMNAVKSSWNGMRNGLVSAAQNIKTNVSSDISKLSSNIASFYRKIRNPALLIAGPGPSGPSSVNIPRMSFAGPSRELDLLDNAPYLPCMDPDGCYAGSWNVSNPNISAIMGRVKGYVPNFPGLGNLGLKVNDFTNSTFPIRGNLSAFTTIADKIISPTRYKFYYNSEGSPQAMLNRGEFNCWDGTMIMGALASAFGLPWEIIHSFWGNTAHVLSKIGGKYFDTTAKQKGYGWTSPSVRIAGPSTPIPSFTEADVIKIELEDNVNLTIKLEDVPNNMDEATLIESFKKIITDSGVLKKLIKNREFMDILKIELSKAANKKKRAGG